MCNMNKQTKKSARPYEAPCIEEVNVRLAGSFLTASVEVFVEDDEFSFFNS